MFEKVRNFIVYGGADKESFDAVKPRMREYNRTMTLVFGSVAVILITAMLVLSFYVNSLMGTKWVYAAGIGFSLMLVVMSLLARKVPALSYVAMYMAMSGFLLYGIAIGTITRADQPTVTFMVMLMMVPLVFVDKPINVGICLVIHIALFLVMAFRTETGDTLSSDVSDAFIFGILSLISQTVVNGAKIKGYVLEDKLRVMGETDQLTGLNNRNCYEARIPLYRSSYGASICCVYVDANGLHELNNERGHVAGDEMLRCVADAVSDQFGKRDAYRVGGDEFVAFAVDVPEDEVASRLQAARAQVSAAGYHAAMGYAFCAEKDADIDGLIVSAETEMFEDKARYYAAEGRKGR